MIVKRWALTVSTYSGSAMTRFWTKAGAERARRRVVLTQRVITAAVWRIA